MKSDEIPQIKTQIAIVVALIDGTTKSQRQIAKEIGKEESTVSRALEYLAGVVKKDDKIIESGRRNKGKYKNKLCYLTYSTENGQHVLHFLKKVSNYKYVKETDKAEFFNFLKQSDQILSLLLT